MDVNHPTTELMTPRQLRDRIAELEAELAKERGGWDAFLKLRKSVAGRDFPGLTGEIRTSDAEVASDRSAGS